MTKNKMDSTQQKLALAEYYFRNKYFSEAEVLIVDVLEFSPHNSKANELFAYIKGNQGDLNAARRHLIIACQDINCSAESLYYLGSSYSSIDQYTMAIECLNNALNKAGDFFEGLHDLGIAQAKLGLNADALHSFNKALILKPDSYKVLYNIGKLHHKSGNLAAAISFFDRSTQFNPDFAPTWFEKANVLNDLKKFPEALQHFNKATLLKNDYAIAWLNKGVTLNMLQRHEEALDCYSTVIKIEPENAKAFSETGVTLIELKQYDEALKNLEIALKIDPNFCDALINKGVCLHKTGRYEEALFYYDQALNLNSSLVDSLINKGLTLNTISHYDEALINYNRAILIDNNSADAHQNRAHTLFNMNFYEKAWADYEWRWLTGSNSAGILKTTKPLWKGEKSKDRLFIWAEQGIGDQILYSSVFNELSSYPQNIIVSLDKKLLPLFKRSFPNFTFIDKSLVLSEDEYDQHMSIGSLASFFRKSKFDFANAKLPYLIDDNDKTIAFRKLLKTDKQFTCGISWRSSNKDFGNDKSIPITAFAPLLNIMGGSFVNLQYNNPILNLSSEIEKSGLTIVDEVDIYNDIDSLASLINACDVIVTCSNSTAHLAGALSKRTFLLLPKYSGRLWYWNDINGSSIWYPSVKVIRQESLYAWDKPIYEVIKNLIIPYN